MYISWRKVSSVSNMANNRIICPYCGYRLPISFSSTACCKEISVICKGRNCKKSFNVIIKDGVQKNLVPDDDTIYAFQQVFGKDYKKHIHDVFGVVI